MTAHTWLKTAAYVTGNAFLGWLIWKVNKEAGPQASVSLAGMILVGYSVLIGQRRQRVRAQRALDANPQHKGSSPESASD